MEDQEQNSSSRNITGTLGKVPVLLLNILRNRLELLSIEIREEKQRLMSVLIWLAVSVILGALALILVTLTIVMLCPETVRPYALVLASLVYLGLAIWAMLNLRRQFRESNPVLESTVEQLKKDMEWIRSKT